MSIKYNFSYPIVVVDTETGGLLSSPSIDWSLNPDEKYEVGSKISGKLKNVANPILELGAIILNPQTLEEQDCFHGICGPEKKENFKVFLSRCSKTALNLNGFSNRLDELKTANPLSDVLKNFIKWLPKKWIPCGQNVRFDIDMINSSCSRYNLNFQIKSPPLELMSFSQLYFAFPDTEIVANYKLSTVASALHISTENAHSAIADVRMTAECLRKIFNRFSNK